MSLAYDIHIAWDPRVADTPADRARLQKRLVERQQVVRALLPRLRQVIENPKRKPDDVFQVLRSYYQQAGRDLPMTAEDLPEIETQARLVLELGGLEQNHIQRVLLWLVGATAAPRSVPFLLEMLHFSRRGDHFGPERRQLALWGLARIAMLHNVQEAYLVLPEGLADRQAEVRLTAIELTLDAHLSAQRPVPQEVLAVIQHMAGSDPDKDVQRFASKVLREPWTEWNRQDAQNGRTF